MDWVRDVKMEGIVSLPLWPFVYAFGNGNGVKLLITEGEKEV